MSNTLGPRIGMQVMWRKETEVEEGLRELLRHFRKVHGNRTFTVESHSKDMRGFIVTLKTNAPPKETIRHPRSNISFWFAWYLLKPA